MFTLYRLEILTFRWNSEADCFSENLHLGFQDILTFQLQAAPCLSIATHVLQEPLSNSSAPEPKSLGNQQELFQWLQQVRTLVSQGSALLSPAVSFCWFSYFLARVYKLFSSSTFMFFSLPPSKVPENCFSGNWVLEFFHIYILIICIYIYFWFYIYLYI